VEKEATSSVRTKGLERYLETEEQDSSGYDPTSTASEGEVAKAKKEQGIGTLADPQEALDKADSEGLTLYWVQAKVAGAKPKVHLPSAASLEVFPVVAAVPKCGASGTFELMKAEDPLDPATRLCKRCSPCTEGLCGEICNHMFLNKNMTISRCFRRCECAKKDHTDHFCGFHTERPKREGAGS